MVRVPDVEPHALGKRPAVHRRGRLEHLHGLIPAVPNDEEARALRGEEPHRDAACLRRAFGVVSSFSWVGAGRAESNEHKGAAAAVVGVRGLARQGREGRDDEEPTPAVLRVAGNQDPAEAAAGGRL